MHAVVFDFQIRDTGPRALTPLEIDEELPAVRVDRTKLVKLGIVPVGDDTAITQLRRRLFADDRCQHRVP